MKLLFSSILLLLSCATYSQADKATIKLQAQEIAKATIEADWETVINYTYPKITQLMGGKEQMVQFISNSIAQQQIVFESAVIGDPGEIYRTGDTHLFSLVPQTLVLKTPNAKLKTEGYLLAVSEDRGQRWYFIDTAQLTMENVQSMLPNYNMELVIPPKKQAVLLD